MASAFSALFNFLLGIFKWTLDGVLWIIGKVLFLAFDGILTVIQGIFLAIDVSSFAASYAMSWAGLPTQMIWLINAVGIPQGIILLVAAIGIRLLLNLIPGIFTRI